MAARRWLSFLFVLWLCHPSTMVGAEDARRWHPQDLLASQEQSGSWPPMPIGGTRIDATAYALLALSGSSADSASLKAADRAAHWLSQQRVDARVLDLHSQALAFWAVADWSQMRGKHTWDAWLQNGLTLLQTHQLRHRQLDLPLAWPRKPGNKDVDTATSITALLALTAIDRQEGLSSTTLLGGCANWFTLAWSAANPELPQLESPSRFPSRYQITLGKGSIPVDTDTGRSDAGLLAAILLSHKRNDLSRRSLKLHLARDLLPRLSKGEPDLRRWWMADLAWRMQFDSQAAQQALAEHHALLLKQLSRHGHLPLLHWCLRVTHLGTPLPHSLRNLASTTAIEAEADR